MVLPEIMATVSELYCASAVLGLSHGRALLGRASCNLVYPRSRTTLFVRLVRFVVFLSVGVSAKVGRD